MYAYLSVTKSYLKAACMKYAMQIKTCIKLKEILYLKVLAHLKMFFQCPSKKKIA